MFGLNFPEILIIALAAGILLFGSKKIVDIARSMGRFTGEFQKGKRDIEQELKAGASEVTSAVTATDTPNTVSNNQK